MKLKSINRHLFWQLYNQRSSMLRRSIILFFAALLSILFSVPAPAQVVTPFALRAGFPWNGNGDIHYASNSIGSCSLLSFAPTAEDLTNTNFQRLDTIKYTFIVKNTSTATAENIVFSLPIPTNMTFVTGTLQIDGITQDGTSGKDKAQYLAVPGKLIFNLGSGANSSTGGSLSTNVQTIISYNLMIKSTVVTGDLLTNTASVSYRENSVNYLTSAWQENKFNNQATIRFSPTKTTDCSTARSGTSSSLNNNSYTLAYIDTDNDPSTFSSSSANLNLPSGSQVLFAGLYWGGSTITPASSVYFKPPTNSSYLAIGATKMMSGANFTGTTSDYKNSYQGFADVTSYVQSAGQGTYTLANVKSDIGADNMWAGWTLVVAYSHPSEPARNLAVFEGYASVSAANNSVSMQISGFHSPPVGTVKAKVGVIAYDGDRGENGDNLNFKSPNNSTPPNGGNFVDTLHPINNAFSSTIANLGVDNNPRTPNYINQLGYDASIFNADGYIKYSNINPEVADITLTTKSAGGESYIAGLITSAIDLYEPNVTLTKTYIDLNYVSNGNQVKAGDILEYTIGITNNKDTAGNGDPANNNVIVDAIPANTTYIPGSLVIVGATPSAQSDLQDPDPAEFDPTNHRVIFRLGTGATGYSASNYPYVAYNSTTQNTGGGVLSVNTGTIASPSIGSTATVKFKVQINANNPINTQIANQAENFFTGTTLGKEVRLIGVSPAVVVTVAKTTGNVLLVKRITAVKTPAGAQTNFIQVLHHPGEINDLNLNWPSQYLKGSFESVLVQPQDSIEYTIYFLSSGSNATNSVSICDWLPPNTEFVPDAYTTTAGIQLVKGTTQSSLTNASDGDLGTFYSSVDSASVPSTCAKPSTNPGTSGTVLVKVGSLSTVTTPTTPTSDSYYGYIRFWVKVKS
jgi:uncharacterized repeat protein (TIGR01451 family)